VGEERHQPKTLRQAPHGGMVLADPFAAEFADQMAVTGMRKAVGAHAAAEPLVRLEEVDVPTLLRGAVGSSKSGETAADDDALAGAASGGGNFLAWWHGSPLKTARIGESGGKPLRYRCLT